MRKRHPKQEHKRTAVAAVEETIPDVTVNGKIAESVLRGSIERLEGEIDEMVADVESRFTGTDVTLDKEKIREFRGIKKTADHNPDNGDLNVQEGYSRNLAKEDPTS